MSDFVLSEQINETHEYHKRKWGHIPWEAFVHVSEWQIVKWRKEAAKLEAEVQELRTRIDEDRDRRNVTGAVAAKW